MLAGAANDSTYGVATVLELEHNQQVIRVAVVKARCRVEAGIHRTYVSDTLRTYPSVQPFAHNFPDYARSSFERLCDLANVTKSRSIQDREGWDYLVEFARARIRGLPHDQQPGNATVRVQVKSKSDGKPIASVKLSNAPRFANEPDPCFVVLWWRTPDHCSSG